MFLVLYSILQAHRHPNVVQLRGIVVDDPSSLSLLTELSPLGSLRRVLNETPQKLLGAEAAQAAVLGGIASAMAFLHAQHPMPILHHDLKSDNVLLWPDAETGLLAKVSDFGMATGTGGSTMHSSAATKLGAGTHQYAAPETFDDIFTAQSDVYAFGVVFWEVLTAKLPWGGMGDKAILMAVCFKKERPPLPAELAGAPSGKLLDRCWAQEPGGRPTFAKIAEMLESAKGVPEKEVSPCPHPSPNPNLTRT